MNILISINDEFVDVAVNMLLSVHMYNPEKLNIYLIYERISSQNIEKMKKFFKQYEIGELYPYYIDLTEKDFKINIEHISRETYFRLYAPYVLPEDIDRVLYLDGDLICNGSISQLYNTSFDGNIIAACENVDPDPNFIPWINSRLELPFDNIYYNAGVLLIDMKAYRKFITIENLNDFIEKNREKIWCQDQDIINKMFNGKIKKIDNTYNYQINHINVDQLEFDKTIVHYVSPPKPWKNDYFLPFHGVAYYKFLIKTQQIDKCRELVELHVKNANFNADQLKNLKNLIENKYN